MKAAEKYIAGHTGLQYSPQLNDTAKTAINIRNG